jgi:hypothetical protein
VRGWYRVSGIRTAIANYEPVPRHLTHNQTVTSVNALQLPSETPVNPALEAPGYCRVSLLDTDLPGSPGEQTEAAVPTWMLS